MSYIIRHTGPQWSFKTSQKVYAHYSIIPAAPLLAICHAPPARQLSTPIGKTNAPRERLEQLADQKLEAEAQAFERMHPQLVKQYPGQFVAVHEGQIVDADVDFEALFLRLQKRLGDVPVLIRPVSAEPALELRAPSPRLERSVG